MSQTKDWDAAFDGPPISQTDPAAVAERHARSSRRHRHHAGDGKRRDIQGLRMVAVVAVVINHLTGHPCGGFVGVDVFFVISGFLITGHLLREHGKNGRISLLDFYKRRIRRLFPAALTVTVGTVAAAWLVFSTQRFHGTVTDAVWATLFGANWRSINIGTDYFAASGPVSPLQHYWSLSVEEQFYVAWPLVMLLALLAARWLAPQRASGRTVAAFTAAAALTGTSLAFAAAQSSSDPVVAYFSTFTRGWELGLGALLAVLAQTGQVQRMTGRVLPSAASWAGLAMIVGSLFTVTQARFPFPGALLPCLGSAVVIIAGCGTTRTANFVLTSRPSNYLGDISYSIYVVHFPVIIFAGALLASSTAATDAAILMLTLAASMLLFHLIEDPIRRSNWLKPKRERGQYVDPETTTGRALILAVAVAVCSFAVFVIVPPPTDTTSSDIAAALNSPTPTPSATQTGTGTASASPAPTVHVGPKTAALDQQIKAALLTDTWPTLTPPLGQHTPSPNRECGNALKPPADCTWGNPTASKVIYLVGDSTSEAYTQAFAAMVSHAPDWRLRAAGGSGCPFADVVLTDGPKSPGCAGRNVKLLAEIETQRPDIVVDTDGEGNLTGSNTAHILAELEKVRNNVGTVVMLPPNPIGPDPNSCYTKVSKPTACVGQPDDNYKAWLARNEAMAQDLHGVFIDPTAWFCVNDYCPAFVGHTPTRKDGIHITDAYSKQLGPVLFEAFQQHGLLK